MERASFYADTLRLKVAAGLAGRVQSFEGMHDDFLEHGVATIEKVRQTRPVAYLQIIASIMPKDVNVGVSAVEAMTDDELNATIKRLLTDPALDDIRGDLLTEH